MKDFDIDFVGHFDLDFNGYLDPVVKDIKIDLGESNFVQENVFLELFTYQFIHLSLVVLHNTAWIYGPDLFSGMLGPVMDKYLNHYQQTIKFVNPIRGQED